MSTQEACSKTSPKPCAYCKGSGKTLTLSPHSDELPEHYKMVAGIGFDFGRCKHCSGRGSLVREVLGKYPIPKNVDKTK